MFCIEELFHASGPFGTFELTWENTAMSWCDNTIALRSTSVQPPKDAYEPLVCQRTYVSYFPYRVSCSSGPGNDENIM